MKNGMITDSDGTRKWYRNGQLHRTDGPAYEGADGDREWYLNGKLHRTDGPAVEWANGTRWWYLNGLLHRTDGPAIEWANGDRGWYLNDTCYTFVEWLEHNTTLDHKTRIIYMLRYSEGVAA